MKINIKKLEKSEIEISGSIAKEDFEKYEDGALTKISERLELPGFRKGKAPTKIVKENVTDMMVLEEMAELALMDSYPRIIREEKIDAIGRPQISITKIARGSDLEFKIVTAVLPEMKLPNYKKIANEIKIKNPIDQIKIDESEVEKTILELRKMRAEQAKGVHEDHENMTEEEHVKAHEIKEKDYPPFDDAFAKSFGDFKDAQALKDKIRSNMKIEKETEAKDKLRLAIVEELLEKTEGDIPEVLIEGEIEKILYRLQADITNTGLKYEDYLTQIKKTEEDLRKEWRPDADKRAKLQMVIHAISEKENLTPSEEEIEKEVESILNIYKDADPARARAYIENVLENEKVFKFLEEQ